MSERPSSPRYRRILELADSTAASYGHDYVGVEHLLLAILDEDHSLAAAALRTAACTDSVRSELLRLMNQHPTSAVGDPAQP
jgi:ATP-dependent Clp protease ATP-binding subunit ClpA